MIESCPKRNLLGQLLLWHFYEAPKEILKAWRNFLVFNINYFSIPLLLKTLFSHWRRYKESYGRGFDIKVYSRVFLGNMISRVLGAVVRTSVILVGLAVEIFIFLGGIIVFCAWLFLPILMALGFITGMYLLL